MNILYLIIGVLIFLMIALDIIKTALSFNGGGIITNLVSKAVWNTLFTAAGKKGSSKLLEYAGQVVLVSILTAWVLGLWLGFFLILLSDPDSVQKSSNMVPASALEKLYFAGFTLSTLGVGDYIASSDLWRIVTGVGAFAGLAFITTSITYFVPVLSAVALQSHLSLYISSMGNTPQQILINSWNGKDFSSFFDNAPDLCQMLMQHTLNHHSYPVINYFHNRNRKLAIAPAIALLDETIQLLIHVVPKDAGANQLKMQMLQTALDAYLEMLKGRFLKYIPPKENAPTPDLKHLEEQGIPLKKGIDAKQVFNQDDLQKHRNLLTSMLEMDGWSWKHVYQS